MNERESRSRRGTPAFEVVREVRTSELRAGDVVDWRGERRLVAEVVESDAPAAFGVGTAWNVTLIKESGESVPLAAASSHRWVRVARG